MQLSKKLTQFMTVPHRQQSIEVGPPLVACGTAPLSLLVDDPDRDPHSLNGDGSVLTPKRQTATHHHRLALNQKRHHPRRCDWLQPFLQKQLILVPRWPNRRHDAFHGRDVEAVAGRSLKAASDRPLFQILVEEIVSVNRTHVQLKKPLVARMSAMSAPLPKLVSDQPHSDPANLVTDQPLVRRSSDTRRKINRFWNDCGSVVGMTVKLVMTPRNFFPQTSLKKRPQRGPFQLRFPEQPNDPQQAYSVTWFGLPNGILVRAKLEVIVAGALSKLGISYEYEQKLSSKSDPNDFRLPDFTVSYGGDTFYWEHLGMLSSHRTRKPRNASGNCTKTMAFSAG
jgi:hypothetical protein